LLREQCCAKGSIRFEKFDADAGILLSNALAICLFCSAANVVPNEFTFAFRPSAASAHGPHRYRGKSEKLAGCLFTKIHLTGTEAGGGDDAHHYSQGLRDA
jgi:hypothetical protein